MERYQQIERSIITTYRKEIYASFIKAIREYDLIQNGDKICVCISGGKDSMLMGKLFQELKKHSSLQFDVEYILMNPGYNNKNYELIKKNLSILNIDAKIYDTNIFEVSAKQEKNPCFLCAKMRRGALYRIASELGCNKIALGHHYDDVIETTLMSMLTNGSFQTMLPKLHSDNYPNMELIRPMYLIRERVINNWKKHNDLEFIQCACKLTERNETEEEGQRKATKKLIQELKTYCPNVEKNIFKSASNVNLNMILGYKKDDNFYSFLDDYKNKK